MIDFELSGFQTVKRDNIRVVINQTLAVNQQMKVATLQETVTVTGESPVVDTTTTTMGTNFAKELLTESRTRATCGRRCPRRLASRCRASTSAARTPARRPATSPTG